MLKKNHKHKNQKKKNINTKYSSHHGWRRYPFRWCLRIVRSDWKVSINIASDNIKCFFILFIFFFIHFVFDLVFVFAFHPSIDLELQHCNKHIAFMFTFTFMILILNFNITKLNQSESNRSNIIFMEIFSNSTEVHFQSYEDVYTENQKCNLLWKL